MRQAGIIAAGALYALEHHVDRLAEDHQNAQVLAEAVEETPGLSLESGPVETNLVWIDVDPALGTASEVAARLKARGRAGQRPRARRCSGPAPTWTSRGTTSTAPPMPSAGSSGRRSA